MLYNVDDGLEFLSVIVGVCGGGCSGGCDGYCDDGCCDDGCNAYRFDSRRHMCVLSV